MSDYLMLDFSMSDRSRRVVGVVDHNPFNFSE